MVRATAARAGVAGNAERTTPCRNTGSFVEAAASASRPSAPAAITRASREPRAATARPTSAKTASLPASTHRRAEAFEAKANAAALTSAAVPARAPSATDGQARAVDAEERLAAVAEHRHRVPGSHREAHGTVAEVDVRGERQVRREDADAVVDGDRAGADVRARGRGRREHGEGDEKRK